MKDFNFLMKNTNLESAVWNDGQPTVNRQSTDGQSQRQYSVGTIARPLPDSVSNPCRVRVLDYPQGISGLFSGLFSGISFARVWKHVAMIFAVLVMSMANIGMAWGTSYIPGARKVVTANETITYSTMSGANATTTGKWIVNPRGGTTSSKGYTNVTSDANGNPGGITDNIASTASNVNMPTVQVPSTAQYNQSGKYVLHMRITGITGMIVHGVTGSSSRGVAIYGQEYSNSLTETTAYGSALTSMTRSSNSGSFILQYTGFTANKEYLITVAAVGGDVNLYAIELIASSCTPITPTFSTDYTSTTLTVGGGNSSTPVINKDGSSGAITWTSSDDAVATVDEDGVVTPVAAGSATITATVAEAGGKCEGSVSKNFTINRDPVGEDHVLTWPITTVSGSSESNVSGGTTDIGTGDATSTSTYITNQTDLIGVGVKRTTTGKNSNTGKIETPTSYDAAKYVSFTFDVEDGYQFTPTEVSIKTVAVTTAKDLKFEFSDANGSYSVTKANLSTNAAAATNTLDFSECNVDFTGTVTVKIYVYGANDTYRLSTPLTITGTVAEETPFTCADKYSFHYGPAVGDWETPICFEKVGSTHEWNITNFAIPDHTNGQFWVGYAGSTNGQSATKAWTDSYSDGNGAMKLLPTSTSIVGQATGAVGTINIWDDTAWKNQNVGFTPNGYGITYGGSGHAFHTTATDHMLETDVVTLPDVSSTYTMGLATATAGTYVTCAHSKAAEALSAMGTTELEAGKKKIYLYSTADSWIGSNAKMAIYDFTNSRNYWGDNTDANKFMTKVSDNLWEGYVLSDATSIILVRVNPENSDPGWGWGQSHDITLSSLNNYFTITGTWSDSKAQYTVTTRHPATGDKGKFRMWDNSSSNNWYVHWIPYYVLSYDANGGTGTTAAAERNSESSTLTVTTAANGFTAPTGYQFAGWATSDARADAGTVDYAAGASYTLTSNATLYAVWQPKSCTIELNNQSATNAGTASVTATYNANTNLLVPISCPSKTGYFFDGYYTETGGNGTQLIDRNGNFLASKAGYTDASRNWIHDGGVTLYAKWTALTVTLTISPSIISPSTATNVTYTITTNAPTGTTIPYTFAIFNFGASDNTSGYLDGDHNINSGLSTTVSMNMSAGTWYTRAVILWSGSELATSAKTELLVGSLYTVTYQYNGATDGASPASATAASVTLPTPTKTSYTFDGWYNTAGTKIGDGGDSYSPTADITLYARWQSACAGGGGGGSTTLFSTDFTESGWSSLNNTETAQTLTIGGHSVYVRANSTSNLLSVNTSTGTLTWSGRNFSNKDCYLAIPITGVNGSLTITVANGSSETRFGYAVVAGSTIANPSSAANTSSANPSVYTAEDLEGTSYVVFLGRQGSSYTQATSISITTPGGGGTCYHVYYHGNGAESGFVSDPGAYANSATPTVLDYNAGSYPLVKDGYTFQGWATSAGGSVAKTAGQTVTISSADVHLYAVWAETPICTAVAAPTGLTCSAQTSNSLTFTWTKADHASGYTASLYNNSGCTGDPVASENLGDVATVTFSTLSAETTYYCKVQSHGDGSTYCAAGGTTSATSGTTSAAAVLTAIDADVLYQAADMANITFTGSDQHFTGLSTNHLFKVYGTLGTSDAFGKNETIDNITDDISEKSFTSAVYITTANNKTETADPTQGAIEIITPSTPGILYLYLNSSSSGLTLKKKGTATSTSLSGAKYKAMAVDANTHYFINGSGSNRGLYAIKYVSTYSVSITTTNTTKVTGDATAVQGKAYTATFTANTGYTLPSDATVTIGGTPQTKGSGYTWTISDGTATLTIPAAKVTGAINISVVGETPAGHTVTYNYNGATSGASPASETGASVTLPTPTRTGYELDGWYATDGTKAGIGGATYEPEADITLYAKWYATCMAGGSTDVYNGENVAKGSNTASGWTINSSSNMTLTSGSASGYSYWYQASSSTNYVQFDGSASLVSGDQIKIQWTHTTANKDLELSINDSGVSLTSGGHVSTANTLTEAVYNVTSTLSLTSIKLNSSGSGGCRIFQVTLVTATGGTCYHVTYDGNGATSGFVNDTTAYKSGDEVTVLANGGRYPYVKGLYEIKGWADTKVKADAGTVDYAPGATFTITADKTLYAVWSNEYAITYHLNGASWAGGYTAPAQYTYSTGVTLPVAGNMSNPGYTFNGWYANSDLSTGGVVTAIGTSESGSKEFWAKWTENTYTVTYNANGGSGSMETTVGRYVYLRENTFTYAGHIFMGWNTAANGSGISYNDEDEVELTADITLYAQWGTTLDATWSITKIDGKLYRGGGGYSVTVYLNQADWDAIGDVNDLELTATEGVVLSNITKTVNGEGKAQVTANFAITTDVAADATAITFTLSVPAAGTYASVELPHNENLDDCGGGGSTDPYVIGYSNSNATNISSSAANRAYQTASNWLSTGNTEFTEKTSTDGFTISANTASYYWQNNGSFTTSSSSNCRIRTIKMGNANNPTIRWTNEDLVFSKVRFIGRNTSDKEATTLTVSNGTTSRTFTFDAGSGGVQTKEVTMDFVSGNTKGIAVTEGTKEINVLIELIPASGGITPTLNWETNLSGGESKRTSDDGFIHTASQNTNSLGAITYSSNNTAVATVNATTGEVHLEGASGEATITATIAASGCYNTASVSYVVTVEDDCDDVAGTITTEDLGCSGIKMTVTGHTTEAGVHYQWYKTGSPDETVGTDQDNYTATAAGSYYVIVTNTGNRHCAKRSRNTVTVEAQAAATATKIVDSWYVKNGRRTPDIALVKTENASGFYVMIGSDKIWDSNGSVTTGFGGCSFHLGNDSIIYLNGMKDNGDATSGLDAGDVTLKITAVGCSGNSSELSITIHKQAATSYKSVAFVVDGTKDGAWNAVTSGHADGTPLYEYLDTVGTAASARKFALTECNIYKTTDEKSIREHYSQFDAIVITDDPNTGTKSGSTSYVDAFGTMIDVRPILSMEAYVSKLSNWKAKGVSGDPSSPNPRQYEMRLQCKDHEIYSGLPAPAAGTHVWSETIDGEEYRHVIMVDSTKSPYAGVPYNEQTGGKQKPALQGFESEDMGNLLGLGLILNGTLRAGVERQEEPAARMMLLGIQNQALPNALTEEGKKVIENALKYLLKTNMEEVDDCSNFFKGGTEGKERDWNTATNWEKNTLPTYETKVRILAPCELSGATVRVAQVDIVSGGTSSKMTGGTCSGSLTIASDAALIVTGKVRSAEAPHFASNDLKPTELGDLTIKADETNGNGTLIFDNKDGNTQAVVEMYSKAQNSVGSWSWQYVAVPFNDNSSAYRNYYGSWLYRWAEDNSGWEVVPNRGAVYPWIGYCLTQETAKQYVMDGTLVETTEQEFTVGSNQDMVIGNSWTAPIQVKQFTDDDFGDLTKNIYLFNTGLDSTCTGSMSGGRYESGTYVVIPIHSAEYTGDSLISSLQAFTINNSSGSDATLTLDYDRHVRPTRSTDKVNAGPMHAPKRMAEESDKPVVLKILVSGDRYDDRLVLLEREDFSRGYDAGWDGEKILLGGNSQEIFSVMESGQESVTATPDMDGTVIGFRAGEDDIYTFHFEYDGYDEPLYLLDTDTKIFTRVLTGNIYTFMCTDKRESNRFLLTRKNAQDAPTDNADIRDEYSKPLKFLNNDKIYIYVRGVLYDITGKVVK